ncbi:Abi family protein [Cellulosimicrobium sp. KWT-B]|uniref:Abi family protein n=1 Tax=Cellulosimicrobium sp. KWT-B TaxID=1981152 RepID=UPI000A3213FB|nr:Abi family protein [Cellulosimicrobium sp. KWT-B]
MSKQDPYDALEPHISEPRLRQYLGQFAGDKARALELYRWNAQLAAAFFVDLGHLEVALRNALDARMQARHVALGLPNTWLDDPRGELGRNLQDPKKHRQPYRDIATARDRVRQNMKAHSHGQVLSETSFGLWHQLVSKRWTNLWPDLAHAFPHAPDRTRETVADPISDLRDLRNRIGHHHRIWPLACDQLHDQLLDVAGHIDPELRTWIETNSVVPALLAASPLLVP